MGPALQRARHDAAGIKGKGLCHLALAGYRAYRQAQRQGLQQVAVPPHLLKATYGGNFKEEDGKLVAYDGNGQKIYSRSNPGELASFDEALEMIVNADPFKDHILKGTGAAGSGAKPGEGGPGAAKTYTRTEFDKLTPAAAAAAAKDVREGKASIVDA